MSRIVIVTTSHTEIPDIDVSTGVWYEELAAPYFAFRDAGMDVTLASIEGGDIPFDGRSLAETPLPEPVQRFHEDEEALAASHASLPVGAVRSEDYDAIFLPGGHGTMWDFPESTALGSLVAAFLSEQKIVAAVCHGPAALIGIKREDGSTFIRGRSLTCFSNNEEYEVHLHDKVPFLLEDRLRDLGAQVSTGPDFAPYIMEDGRLLTGQNPKSSAPLAARVVALLKEQAR